MKTILYMAVSINGMTTNIDDTSWVEKDDVTRMDKLMAKCGVMIMGSHTYRSFGDELPLEKALQVILTKDVELLQKKINNVRFTNESPKDVLLQLEREGFNEVMIAGGGILNTTLLNENLIDEIRLIIKPIIIGKGKNLFSEIETIRKFILKTVKKLENGSVEVVYRK